MVCCLPTFIYHKNQLYIITVGKYTSHMDAMGKGECWGVLRYQHGNSGTFYAN